MRSRSLIPILLLALVSSCASINSVSLTPIPGGRGTPVRAEVSKTIILGFNFDNDYINSLTEQLQSQCPNGLVAGILTKDEVFNYFFAHTRHVVATGYCVGSSSRRAGLTPKNQSIAEVQ